MFIISFYQTYELLFFIDILCITVILKTTELLKNT
ncbi:MAG: hypothetical protein PETM_01546 [Petrimonas sp.]